MEDAFHILLEITLLRYFQAYLISFLFHSKGGKYAGQDIYWKIHMFFFSETCLKEIIDA